MPKSAMSALSFSGHALRFARLQESPATVRGPATLPISVIIAAKNEARNLPACLESLQNFG